MPPTSGISCLSLVLYGIRIRHSFRRCSTCTSTSSSSYTCKTCTSNTYTSSSYSHICTSCRKKRRTHRCSSCKKIDPFVCLSPENFDEENLLQLKLILKRNPEKNINLAKQFFRQNHGDPNKLLDYDHEVRKLYITRCSSLFPSFRLMLKTKFALMALSGKNTELV